jgi:cell division protein FtsZ
MMAIQSPLLETTIDSARGVIISITASPDIGLDEVDQAATLITENADPDANIIWGAAFDTNLVDEMKITVIATGFDTIGQKQPEAKPVAETKSTLGIGNWFDDNNKAHSTVNDDDYLNDVISILKKNSAK